MPKAIALFSGGLDSILAAKLIAAQNIEVIGLAFTTPFFRFKQGRGLRQNINFPLLVEDITPEYLEMLKAPRYGLRQALNPCIDCHTLM